MIEINSVISLHFLDITNLNILSSKIIQFCLWIVPGIAALMFLSWLYDNYKKHQERKQQKKADDALYIKTRTPYDDIYFPDQSEEYQSELRHLKANDGQPLTSLSHKSVALFHLPFAPYRAEVIYVENAYKKAANRFVRENIDMIRQQVAAKGFRFVYLPDVRLTDEMVKSTLENMTHERIDPQIMQCIREKNIHPLQSTFLLNFMRHPENISHFSSGFAWYNRKETGNDGFPTFVYDVITFDGSEALAHPEWMMEKIGAHLGWNNSPLHGGVFSLKKTCRAEADFDKEAVKLLKQVRAQLEQVRLMGISEAMITQYVMPMMKPSRLTITHDLRLVLTDWNQEIEMEPLNKAVYLLFLRHPEGIVFKCLTDYRHELNAIYGAVKVHQNNIDERMAKKELLGIVPKGVSNVTNPLHNAINEKCARIRESLLCVMHESLVDLYAVTGQWGQPKGIRLSRDYVTWE